MGVVSEYLEEDDKEGDMLVKQEMGKDDSEAAGEAGSPRYVTLKDISRGYQARKRPAASTPANKERVNNKFVHGENTIIYVSLLSSVYLHILASYLPS